MYRFITLLAVLVCSSAIADTHYVDLNSPSPTPPYDTPQTAANNIQDAVDVAVDGETVMVADGHYYLTSQITVTNNITVQSVNGPTNTIVDGQGGQGFFLGDAECIISGLTITNCYTTGTGGAGVDCDDSTLPVVTNCTFIGNRAAWWGGGMHYGTANNCIFIGNTSYFEGGGMYQGTANNCNFISNVVINSHYEGHAGGKYDGIANNCIFKGNSCQGAGGGMMFGIANNCAFIGNFVSSYKFEHASGGGMSGGIANNCTFTGNIANGGGGGGMSGGTANNCILWDNLIRVLPDELAHDYIEIENNIRGSSVSNCCSPDVLHGVDGNITNAPKFFGSLNSDYRLHPLSPCINAGSNTYVILPTDLADNPRISGIAVDMGAYEYQDMDNDLILDEWEDFHFGSITNCQPADDPDADRYTNFEEFLTRPYSPPEWNYMNPLEWSYYLEISSTPGIGFSWKMVNGTNYQIQTTTVLISNNWDNVLGVIPGNESTDGYFSAPIDVSERFYRVITVP